MPNTKRTSIPERKKTRGEKLSGRYLISGAQIGSLMSQSDGKLTEELKHIIDNQFLYNSDKILEEDIKLIQKRVIQ